VVKNQGEGKLEEGEAYSSEQGGREKGDNLEIEKNKKRDQYRDIQGNEEKRNYKLGATCEGGLPYENEKK